MSITFGVEEKRRVGYDTNRVKMASDENEHEDCDDGRRWAMMGDDVHAWRCDDDYGAFANL